MKQTAKLLSISALVLAFSFIIKSPSVSAQANGKIFYSIFGDESYNIASINPDGTGRANLTNDGMSAYYNLSPDGKRLAYTKIGNEHGFIHIVNTDGTDDHATSAEGIPIGWVNLKKFAYANFDTGSISTINTDGSSNVTSPANMLSLENLIGFPAFSPDGKKISYVKSMEEGFDIHISNLDGSQDSQISSTPVAAAPVFSKDHSKVYFLGSVDGEAISLYSVGIDGKEQTLIHSLPTGQPIFLKGSPDSSKLLYGAQGDTENTIDVYSIGVDGTNQIQTFDELNNNDSINMFMGWSPDSTKLVLTQMVGEGPGETADIFTVNADGSSLINVTNTPDVNEYVTYTLQPWAPVIDNSDGDFNDDGILDSKQANVTSTTDTVTGDRVVLESSDGCTNEELSVLPEESNVAKDPEYDYPLGLMNFTLDCVENGATTTVTQYYYNQPKENYILRKYNSDTKTYKDIPEASISETTIEGKKVTVVTYTITDGGDLDQDGTVNGKIVDPAGLAVVTLAGTGQNYRELLFVSISLVSATTLLVAFKFRSPYSMKFIK